MAVPEGKSQYNQLKQDLEFYRKQEEIYKSMLDKLNVGLLTIKNNKIVTANQKVVKLLGYNLIDLIGLDIVSICPATQNNDNDSVAFLQEAFKSAHLTSVEVSNWLFKSNLNKLITCDLVISSSKIDGDYYVQIEIQESLPKEQVAKKIKEKNREIESLSEERESLNEELRATLDELVEVNKQLTESETWNKSIVDNIPLGLMVLTNNAAEYINEKITEILGYELSDFDNNSLLDYIIPSEKTEVDKFKKRIAKGENALNISVWMLCKNGQKRYLRNQYVKLNQENRYMIICTDLTNEKLKEQEILSTHERLEFAIEANDSVIWDIDNTRPDSVYGENFSKMFGYQPSELVIDRNMWRQIVHPEDLPAVMQELNKHFKGEVPYYEAECRVRVKDGSWRWVLTRGKVYNVNLDGDPERFIGMFVDISRRKEAEENLKFSEEKFRTIVQHLSDIIFIIDKDLFVLYESPSVARTFGYEPGAMVGKNGIEFIHPADIDAVSQDMAEVIQYENDYKPSEIRIKHRKGHWVHVEIIGDNLLHHPAIQGVLLTARDVTERRENENQLILYRDHLEQLVKKRTEEIEYMNAELIAINEELKATNEELADKNDSLNQEIKKRIEAQILLEESENKFRSFLEQSTEGIALINEEGKVVDWNHGMESIFRIRREEVINTYVWEFDYRFLPEKRKTSEQFEELKGSVLDYFATINQNKVLTVDGMYQTIELKQKYLSVTIFPVITSKHKYVGRIVRDITGIRRAQEEIQKQSAELQEINKNLELQKSQLETTLTELRKAQAQLIQSEKMASLGVLTAGVAHEINNPVNYINTALEGLKITIADFLEIFRKYEDIKLENVEQLLTEIDELKHHLDYPLLNEGIRILLNNMQTGIERITEIVKSLRTFARVEENELKFSNIHELIDTTLVMLHNQYKNRIEIIRDYGTLSSINCFPGKLSQVFMNLLSNAIHAIPDKGTISIRTRVNDDNSKFIISIKDSGTGIPEHIKEKIFEPFFTTKEAGKGTGLGLSITYGIIQQHLGEIELVTKQGVGTEFTITLPTDLQ